MRRRTGSAAPKTTQAEPTPTDARPKIIMHLDQSLRLIQPPSGMDILFRMVSEAGRRLAEKLITLCQPRSCARARSSARRNEDVGTIALRAQFAAGCFHCGESWMQSHEAIDDAGERRDVVPGRRCECSRRGAIIAQRGCGDQVGDSIDACHGLERRDDRLPRRSTRARSCTVEW